MVTGLRRGETHVGTGTPGKDRLTSETPQPRTGGARGRHSRVVGGRRGVGSVSSVRPSVPAPVLRTRAAQRRSSTVRLRGPPSARQIRTIVSAAAAAQMAARSAPPRPPAPPRAAHGESGWASPQPRGPTWPLYREECSLPPPARSLPALPCASSPPNARASSASISRPSAWRTWTRPARLPPAPENSSHSRVAEMGPPRML